ncbi:hypothetical protein D3C76_1676410 [compost metagenome]
MQQHFQIAQFIDDLFAASDEAHSQGRRHRLGKATDIQRALQLIQGRHLDRRGGFEIGQGIIVYQNEVVFLS